MPQWHSWHDTFLFLAGDLWSFIHFNLYFRISLKLPLDRGFPPFKGWDIVIPLSALHWVVWRKEFVMWTTGCHFPHGVKISGLKVPEGLTSAWWVFWVTPQVSPLAVNVIVHHPWVIIHSRTRQKSKGEKLRVIYWHRNHILTTFLSTLNSQQISTIIHLRHLQGVFVSYCCWNRWLMKLFLLCRSE